MQINMCDEQGFAGKFEISKKSIYTHMHDYFSEPTQLLSVTIYTFGVLWTFGGAAIQFSGAKPRGWCSYLVLILFSLLTALCWRVYKYLSYIPEGFENESSKSQKIAHLQRPFWQFHLAKVLLEKKLTPIEKELEDIENGKVFLIATKPESFQSYINWSRSSTANLLKMLEVAKQLLLFDFPKALQSTKEKSATPIEILETVNTISRFYKETVEFERSLRKVIPSEELKQLHRLQFGWSDIIRKAVRQLFDFIEQICESDEKENTNIEYIIEFGDVENVEKMVREFGWFKNSFEGT